MTQADESRHRTRRIQESWVAEWNSIVAIFARVVFAKFYRLHPGANVLQPRREPCQTTITNVKNAENASKCFKA